ncbi:MAG: NAD(P)H-dependent oxidoreductase [Frankiaceae bacterium]|nr:NAD(P)H-dependent oxidoreductase [Frankiaceae bacterium]MBV9872037.1 NAD(P)H-dependent oxidoreductase [Frankiaceae bacterium]
MQQLKLMIILASTRPERAGEPIAHWVLDSARDRDDVDVTFVDLKELALPLLDEPAHPRLRRYEHEHTKQWSKLVDAAEAFIFVMPEYNHGYTAPLKNALDYLHHEWVGKPVGFASYGGVAAGTRAVQLLKPVLTCLGMTPLTTAVAVPMVGERVRDGRFESSPELDEALGMMLDELLPKYAAAMRPLRAAS